MSWFWNFTQHLFLLNFNQTDSKRLKIHCQRQHIFFIKLKILELTFLMSSSSKNVTKCCTFLFWQTSSAPTNRIMLKLQRNPKISRETTAEPVQAMTRKYLMRMICALNKKTATDLDIRWHMRYQQVANGLERSMCRYQRLLLQPYLHTCMGALIRCQREN